VKSEAQRELNLLAAVERDRAISQRGLASKLGIAVGLTNLYLKRLARKGYIKCVNARSNRLLYLITPRGIAEKTRLTYEYMDYSLRLYRETRSFFKHELQVRLGSADSRVALYGRGEPAELAYVCLKELAIEPVAVFDADVSPFLGMRVLPLSRHHTVTYDVMLVASLDRPDDLIATLREAGVAEAKLCALRPPTPTRRLRARP
jgi:DNA-binding MarR family transcriptional regulator